MLNALVAWVPVRWLSSSFALLADWKTDLLRCSLVLRRTLLYNFLASLAALVILLLNELDLGVLTCIGFFGNSHRVFVLFDKEHLLLSLVLGGTRVSSLLFVRNLSNLTLLLYQHGRVGNQVVLGWF